MPLRFRDPTNRGTQRGKHPLSESCVDTTLSGDSMTSRREKLGNTSSVETGFGQTESRTQTGTTGTHNNGIILVVLGK